MASPQRSVLFFAKAGHNVAVYRSVLERLLADDRFRLFLATKASASRPGENLWGGLDRMGAQVIDHRWARWKRFDLYLSPDVFLLGRRARVKAHTFHGISIKGKAYTPRVRDYDKLFLIGPYMRERFEALGVLASDDPRFVDIGMPKTDALFGGSLDRNEFLKALGLDPERKTVLYAPTWRPESSLYSIGEEFIRAMQDSPFNLLVKLHDHSYAPDARIDWREQLGSIDSPHIRILRDPDITPAMHAADLLVSDASSVANEFTLLDRPIVFAEVPELLEKYGATVDREGWGQRAGEVAADVPGLLGAIERAFADPSLRSEVRRRIAAEGFYNPGRATDAAVKAIQELVNL